MQIRQALLSAIMNSAEGKVLSADELRQIESAMGITNGIVDENKFTAPLLRRDLKTVIDIIDNASKERRVALPRRGELCR